MNDWTFLFRVVWFKSNKFMCNHVLALGSSGVVTEAVTKTLVWAFRYDTEEGVRAEACHAITALQLKGDNIVQILQDRYLVETSDLVKQ